MATRMVAAKGLGVVGEGADMEPGGPEAGVIVEAGVMLEAAEVACGAGPTGGAAAVGMGVDPMGVGLAGRGGLVAAGKIGAFTKIADRAGLGGKVVPEDTKTAAGIRTGVDTKIGVVHKIVAGFRNEAAGPAGSPWRRGRMARAAGVSAEVIAGRIGGGSPAGRRFRSKRRSCIWMLIWSSWRSPRGS